MKVGTEEWSENSKDEEGHLVKIKAVDKMKIKHFVMKFVKRLPRIFQTCDLLKPAIM